MSFWRHAVLHPWDDRWCEIGYDHAVLKQEFRQATDDKERLEKYVGFLIYLVIEDKLKKDKLNAVLSDF